MSDGTTTKKTRPRQTRVDNKSKTGPQVAVTPVEQFASVEL